jgi:hypothetical protein
VGYFWVLYLGFNWATYVYSLVYLEALDAFFYIYITYQKNLLFVDCFGLLDENKRSRSNIRESERHEREKYNFLKKKKGYHVIREGFSRKPYLAALVLKFLHIICSGGARDLILG